MIVTQQSVDEVVFVGQAPSSCSDPKKPLSGRSGNIIAAMLGLTLEDFLLFRRYNINNEFHGSPLGLGDVFRIDEGEQNALLLLCMHWPRYVLIGQHVQRSFKVEGYPLQIVLRGQKAFFCLPHTSGLNHWYNIRRNREAAQSELCKFVYEA